MVSKVEMYQAEDGTLHDSHEKAREHDIINALTKKAIPFISHHVHHRTVSKAKLQKLLVDFALHVIFEDDNVDQLPGESE